MLKLDLNLLWTVVDVLILYVLLRKFLFKPIQNVLDERQKLVDANLADAQDAKARAQAALTAAEDKLHNVDTEAAARRQASEQQAEKEKEQLLAAAQQQAAAIVAEGKAAAEAERASKLRQADAQIASLTRTVCAKVLERNLTQQDDDRFLNDLLQKAGDSHGDRV
jgi:F-type H+-transporting ATPase subunit b